MSYELIEYKTARSMGKTTSEDYMKMMLNLYSVKTPKDIENLLKYVYHIRRADIIYNSIGQVRIKLGHMSKGKFYPSDAMYWFPATWEVKVEYQDPSWLKFRKKDSFNFIETPFMWAQETTSHNYRGDIRDYVKQNSNKV